MKIQLEAGRRGANYDCGADGNKWTVFGWDGGTCHQFGKVRRDTGEDHLWRAYNWHGNQVGEPQKKRGDAVRLLVPAGTYTR